MEDEEREIRNMLREYAAAEERLKDNNECIKLWRESIKYMRELSAVVADGQPHGNALGDPTANAAIKIIDNLEVTIKNRVDEIKVILEKRTRVESLLNCLNEEEYRLIELRYIKHLKMEHQIPYHMCVSRRTAYNIHSSAMSKLIEKNKSLH